MKQTPIDPGDIVKLNVTNYTHGRLVEGAKDWVILSGQVGVNPDGTWSTDFTEQARRAFANIEACLRDGGMSMDDAVFMRIFLLRREDLDAFRTVRGEVLGDGAVPSTLVFVSGLAHPEWLIEVEIVACRG